MGKHVALADVPSCCRFAGAAGQGGHAAVLSPLAMKGTWLYTHCLALGCWPVVPKADGDGQGILMAAASLHPPFFLLPCAGVSDSCPGEGDPWRGHTALAAPLRQRPLMIRAVLARAGSVTAVPAPAAAWQGSWGGGQGWGGGVGCFPHPRAVLSPSSQQAHPVAFWAGFLHCLTQIGPTATSDLSSSFLNPGLSSL